MMPTKTIYNRMFLNVLCKPFCKCLIIDVRKTLQINILMSEK